MDAADPLIKAYVTDLCHRRRALNAKFRRDELKDKLLNGGNFPHRRKGTKSSVSISFLSLNFLHGIGVVESNKVHTELSPEGTRHPRACADDAETMTRPADSLSASSCELATDCQGSAGPAERALSVELCNTLVYEMEGVPDEEIVKRERRHKRVKKTEEEIKLLREKRRKR